MPQRQEQLERQEEEFWNPYRLVSIKPEPVQHARPHYHRRFEGVAGRIEGVITALTPLIIGAGDAKNSEFIRRKRHGSNQEQPFIPGTSIKGVLRSLAEIIGNAAVPFDKGCVDDEHKNQKGSTDQSGEWRLDAAARIFGGLELGKSNSRAFAGAVRFHDAFLDSQSAEPRARWKSFTIVVGSPKPSHEAFYPSEKRKRKFYHHKPSGKIRETSLSQNRIITPAPTGSRFPFVIDFANLREEDLDLLLYCIALEEDVTVRLSKEALGENAARKLGESVTLRGPMRHKLGGAKPAGAGSVYFEIQVIRFDPDPAARYRTGKDEANIYEGETLKEFIDERTKTYRDSNEQTMQELRAMMVFDPQDPRAKNLSYPSRGWFDDDRGVRTPLKPII